MFNLQRRCGIVQRVGILVKPGSPTVAICGQKLTSLSLTRVQNRLRGLLKD